MAEILDKYILIDKIASGGMAEIWLAKQTGLGGFEKLVVIKKILPNLTNNKEFINMFLDEAYIAAKLNHQNVVQIYDVGKKQGTYYIAMEYISGEDLRTIVVSSVEQKLPLPLIFAFDIISQSANGLHYAHTLKDMYGKSMNIVHRDISPQNILVSYEGIAKVVDFGIAKAATKSQETQAGILKGKLAYMSPEQANGNNIDGRSDIFALGIVLYEITLGVRLFDGDSALRVLKMILEEPIKPPVEVNPKYPLALSKIVMKALEKDPSKRYQSAQKLHLDIEEVLKNYPKTQRVNELSNWMQLVFQNKIDETKKKHKRLLDQTNNTNNTDDDFEPTGDFDFEEEATVIKAPSSSDVSASKSDKFKKIDAEKSKKNDSSNNINTSKKPLNSNTSGNSKSKKNDDFLPFSTKSDDFDYGNNQQSKLPKIDKKPINKKNNDFLPFEDDGFFEEESTSIIVDKEEEEKEQTKTSKVDMKDSFDDDDFGNFEPSKKEKLVKKEKQVKDDKKETKPKSQKDESLKKMPKDDMFPETTSKTNIKDKRKEPIPKILFRWMIYGIILYFIYVAGVIGYKYITVNLKIAEIIKKTSQSKDEELVKKEVLKLCSQLTDVVCDNQSIRVDVNVSHPYITVRYKIFYKVAFRERDSIVFSPTVYETYPF